MNPRVRKIRNEASSCLGIFSRTLRFYYVASSPGSPIPHLLDEHRKRVGCSVVLNIHKPWNFKFWKPRKPKHQENAGKWQKCDFYFRALTPWLAALAAMNWVDRLRTSADELREGKRKRGDAKRYIFDHGIKGFRWVMNTHGTVTGLQQVDHSCLTGPHWEITPLEHSRPNLKAETNEWTSSLPPDKYEVTLTDTHIAISAKILTDILALLTWSPKTCFSVMSTTPSPSAAILRSIVTRSRLPIIPKGVGTTIADCKVLHYCPHQACAGLDPDNFVFNRKEVKNMDLLDKSKIFLYRTTGLGGRQSEILLDAHLSTTT